MRGKCTMIIVVGIRLGEQGSDLGVTVTFLTALKRLRKS